MNGFLWSVRREWWENRSLYIAPLIVAAVAFVGFLFHLDRVPARGAIIPYGIAASVVMFTAVMVGVFYCLDALHGERRDRSILFWKSMPVSDLTSVLAKASVPLFWLPLVSIAIALATQLAMLLAGSGLMLARGASPTAHWSLPWAAMAASMAYGAAVHALWFAPLYGWLLLVSAWARRAVFLCAVLPPFALMVLESIATGTGYVAQLIHYRITGAMDHAFAPGAMKTPITSLSQLTPLEFLRTPGLWAGLAIAAVFIALAVRLRRYRDPT